MSNFFVGPKRALQMPELRGTDIRVLCAIGTHTHKDGTECFARSATLADEARVDRRQFFRSRARLIDAGIIECESGKDEGKPSRYRIIFDDPVVKNDIVGVVEKAIPLRLNPPEGHGENRRTPTINASLNVPFNAPTTARRVKLRAGELIKDVRLLRNPQFPTSLEADWMERFSADAVRVIRAVGIERILTTQPANDGPLVSQMASMLEELAA